jgi:glutathione reductase (NADPH)
MPYARARSPSQVGAGNTPSLSAERQQRCGLRRGRRRHVAAANLIEGNRRKADYSPIPSVVFTLPPLASVGLHEQEARVGLRRQARAHLELAIVPARRRAVLRLQAARRERKTGKLLGAHLLGPRAEELINLFAMAIRCELTMILAYPTLTSDMQDML